MNALSNRQNGNETANSLRKRATLRFLYARPGDDIDEHLEKTDGDIGGALLSLAFTLEQAAAAIRKVRSYCRKFDETDISIEGDTNAIVVEGPESLIDALVDDGLAFPFTSKPKNGIGNDAAVAFTPETQTQIVASEGGHIYNVDALLTPLASEVVKADILISTACEESRRGIAKIEFERADDLKKFVDIVGHYEPGVETLYNRIAQMTVHKDGSCPTGAWDYGIFLADVDYDEHLCPNSEDKPYFEIYPSVRFPVSDLPLLVERMRDHNEQSSRTKKSSGWPTAFR
jgi:hypothetical protein